MRKFLILLIAILTICLVGCSPLENTPVEDVLDESENKINDEVIVDNKNEISQANFFAFSSEMGIVEDMVKSEMVSVKGMEAVRGNNRTNAQIYNYIARGGEKVLTTDNEGDKKWLTQEDAENIACTKINPEYAEDVFGMKLPVRKVNTYKGAQEQVSYFVTPKGNVFCYPPIEYDGKSYVSSDVTIKDTNGNEMSEGQATKENKVTIYFENTDETVIVSNEENLKPTSYVSEIIDSIGVWYPELGNILGIDFNDKKSTSDVTISNYYFEESSEKLLKNMSEYTDITNLKYSKKELEYAKNEIFARHGHDFVSKELEEYFSLQNWYKKIDGKQVSVSELNEIEKENVKLLDEYIMLTKELEEKGTISKRINFYHTLIINKDKTFDVQTLSRKIHFLDEQGNRLKLLDINTGNDAFTTTYFDHEFLASDGYLYSTKDMYDGSGTDSIKAIKVYDKKIVSFIIETKNVNTQYDEFLERDSYTYSMKITFNFEDGTSISEDILYEPDRAV